MTTPALTLTWLEATEAGDQYAQAARDIRKAALDRPAPRRGWIARLEHAAWLRGAQSAAHLLDETACQYRLHAAQLKREAR